MKPIGPYRVMNRVKVLSVALVIGTTASIFLLLPASVRLSVGDSASRVSEIARYGYPYPLH
jgi:hypothetical protein